MGGEMGGRMVGVTVGEVGGIARGTVGGMVSLEEYMVSGLHSNPFKILSKNPLG